NGRVLGGCLFYHQRYYANLTAIIHFPVAAFTPGRCMCPRTRVVKGRLSDFRVFPKRPSCDREELVVTRINPDHSAQLLCMSTEGVRGKRILSCWESINRNESRKLECLHAQPIRKLPPPTPTTTPWLNRIHKTEPLLLCSPAFEQVTPSPKT
uniref:Chemokine interleukin-8-like domain-containing protein n=1 Tax=Haplochromis burtoni TaxID=8153 RepID=A0A3Q2W3R9_HAPBU